MKVYRTTLGPFSEKPFYEPQEIEKICSDELRKVGLLPKRPEPIRIDRFVEKRFNIFHSYEDLPEGILGYTKFGANGVEEIVVSVALEDESRVSERRLRTTIAHEAGHGLLHAHLFVLAEQPPRSLFGDALDETGFKILCRSNAIEGAQVSRRARYEGRWWEYQANLAIGALLLPKHLVETALEPLLKKSGQLGFTVLDHADRNEAAKVLSDAFDVNPIVGKIRVDKVFPGEKSLQLTM